jgi:tRNA(adenine34) deaminase
MEHNKYMLEALKEAEKAQALGEVPIGAVLVDNKNGEIISRGYNLRETNRDPLAHAEIIAIKKAAKSLGKWRLTGTSLYVTVEPCPMCAGAILQARIDRVIYGAPDYKAGAVGSLIDLLRDERFNHQAQVIPFVLEEECRGIMQEFFRKLRERN